MGEGFSPLGEVDGDEFDYLLELVIAIIFMTIGIVTTVVMVRTMDVKTQVNSRVDKVEVSYKEVMDNDPFKFTGYQAYMFSYMIDPVSDIALSWTNAETSGSVATIDPVKHRDNFITYRNNIIKNELAKALNDSIPGGNSEEVLWKPDSEYYYQLKFTNENKNTDIEGTENRWLLKLTKSTQ